MEFTADFIEKFKNENITISFVPKIYQVKELKRNLKDITFSDPGEYLSFLNTEKEFWKQYETNAFFKMYVESYSSAISNFNSAVGSSSSYKSYLKSTKFSKYFSKRIVKIFGLSSKIF